MIEKAKRGGPLARATPTLEQDRENLLTAVDLMGIQMQNAGVIAE
jgi:hypothetical protein